MIGNYTGHHTYNRATISLLAPDSMGVYYIGVPNVQNVLIVHYVGRALGAGVSIKSRLIDHLLDGWRDATHFGFAICTTQKEAEDFEAAEIRRLQPKYNSVGKY